MRTDVMGDGVILFEMQYPVPKHAQLTTIGSTTTFPSLMVKAFI